MFIIMGLVVIGFFLIVVWVLSVLVVIFEGGMFFNMDNSRKFIEEFDIILEIIFEIILIEDEVDVIKFFVVDDFEFFLMIEMVIFIVDEFELILIEERFELMLFVGKFELILMEVKKLLGVGDGNFLDDIILGIEVELIIEI